LAAQAKGAFYEVEQGRRDSRESRARDAEQQLPGAEDSVERLTAMFEAKGLSQEELVTLSGGHTIGFVHCAQFLHRIYDEPTDPSLNPAFAAHLRDACPRRNLDPRVVVNFDDATPSTFDNAYYKTLLCNRGVLSSDQRLSTHPHTQTLVSSYARSSSLFSRNFAAATAKHSHFDKPLPPFSSTHESRIWKLVPVAAQTPPREPGINQIAPPLSTTTLAHPTATPPCVHSLGEEVRETAKA
jgi:catalase (peroxidase I)